VQERLGYISHLERQVKFYLTINGQQVCSYVADAVYFDTTTKQRIVADSKGVSTPVFKLKKRLMKALLNIEVQEI
jgi:type IV secretory pathway protease TraF